MMHPDNTPQEHKTYLALGDSYTIGESIPPQESYPVQTVRLLNEEHLNFLEPKIIATTGWTTADLQKAMEREHFSSDGYDVVTLLIGVNNQYQGRSQQEYREEFTRLLQAAIALAKGGASHVIVVSIPDYSVTPFASGSDHVLIAKEIDAFNEINRQAAAAFSAHYVDITSQSRKAATDRSLVAADGLHFSAREYAIWSVMIAAAIKNLSQ